MRENVTYTKVQLRRMAVAMEAMLKEDDEKLAILEENREKEREHDLERKRNKRGYHR